MVETAQGLPEPQAGHDARSFVYTDTKPGTNPSAGSGISVLADTQQYWQDHGSHQ